MSYCLDRMVLLITYQNSQYALHLDVRRAIFKMLKQKWHSRVFRYSFSFIHTIVFKMHRLILHKLFEYFHTNFNTFSNLLWLLLLFWFDVCVSFANDWGIVSLFKIPHVSDHNIEEVSLCEMQVEAFGRYIFSNSENFSEELVGHDILLSEMIKQIVDKLFFPGVKNLGNDSFVVISNDNARIGEWIIIKVR